MEHVHVRIYEKMMKAIVETQSDNISCEDLFSAPRNTTTITVKIVRAKMEFSRTGRVEFHQEAQMHLDIAESSAKVGLYFK